MKSLTISIAATLILATGQVVRAQEESERLTNVSVTDVTNAARPAIHSYLALLASNVNERTEAAEAIRQNWCMDDAGLLIEAAQFTNRFEIRAAILDLLASESGQSLGADFDAWYQWLWNRDVSLHPNYATFKREIYRFLDPRFAEYFSDDQNSTIRLDEIRWGGVRRDGIPPLSDPKTISADQATYLNDSDVVFGVSLNGQSMAYPKRILAWHEMVKDHVGGLSINGVYCTLCGSMILYETEVDGKHYELGTSGFLYRSNKLMYDHQTKSMWSTLKGEPVVGELVGKGIKLKPRHVVTTTWRQWKADHPETDVLSIETGHRRDYGEGVAYHDYFATDDLMFTVPKIDKRLKNKDEILVIRAGESEPLAIATDYLFKHPVYHDQVSEISFVILTDPTGANRVYRSGGVEFDRILGNQSLRDKTGGRWAITEDALVCEKDGGHLGRLPAHRAFWFGWYADHPDVRLIK